MMHKTKLAAEIPAGIAVPDQVKTRLGTLKFFGGFPDDAGVEKLYDNLDFQRAMQAYLLALPAVSQVANRNEILKLGPASTTVPIFEQMMDLKSLFLTPNNNTPYTWFWLDLSKGPLVLEIPPKVLGLIDDMWYHFVTGLGFMGPDKGESGKFLLLPPGYTGDMPEGYHVVRPATFNTWVAWRTFLKDGDPKPGVDSVKQLPKIYPLVQADNPPQLNFVNVSGRDFNTVSPADYPFWEYLNQIVQQEPTDSVDPITLGLWASFGIQNGKPFNPDARMKKILAEAAFVDAKGKPLDGSKNYKLHLPPNTPVANFWSVIPYNDQTRSMLQTDLHWPAVSSQTQGLQVNPDSSANVYFGPKPPPGKESNWGQTIPGKGWNTLLRLYGRLNPGSTRAGGRARLS